MDEEKKEVIDEESEDEDNFDEDNSPDDKETLTSKMRANPWVAATLVLGVLALLLFVTNFGITGGTITGGAVSDADAGQIFLRAVQAQGADISAINITDISLESNMYKISFDYQGEAYPVDYYLTKDGKLLGTLSPTQTSPTSDIDSTTQEIPKSDKPVVELFVWGYCPYGVQAQGPMVEVAKLLEDSADFKTVLYYDGHGAFETQQNQIQECIQKIAPEKYWDYAAGFVDDVYPVCSQSRDIACDKTESTKVMNSVGIDAKAVFACVDAQGEALIAAASSRASALGVSGSPSIVINGVKVNVARDAESMKAAVCSAFNNAPSECGEALSSTTGTTSGSC